MFLPLQERRVGINTQVTDLFRGSLGFKARPLKDSMAGGTEGDAVGEAPNYRALAGLSGVIPDQAGRSQHPHRVPQPAGFQAKVLVPFAHGPLQHQRVNLRQ